MYIVLLRKKRLGIAGMLIVITLLMVGLVKNEVVPAFNLFVDRPAVVLDAGHGGVDKGTSHGDLLEKEINLDIVLKTAKFLLDRGIAVDLTRDTDEDLGGKLKKGRHRKDLEFRVTKMNRGMVAVSIHVNSGASKKGGALVLYPRENEEAKNLAELVLKEISQVQVLDHEFAIPKSNLYVLKKSQVPTILIEVGFISHPEDRVKLTNPDWRQQMAEAIGTGVLKYLALGN
ncbi:MAG: N-acetylmuramoyl-L-alanine amidase [Clostridia bacterium]|nr:N-acetylmuramoyl-L-alanine amidase [Clostridia bacterium]